MPFELSETPSGYIISFGEQSIEASDADLDLIAKGGDVNMVLGRFDPDAGRWTEGDIDELRRLTQQVVEPTLLNERTV